MFKFLDNSTFIEQRRYKEITEIKEKQKKELDAAVIFLKNFNYSAEYQDKLNTILNKVR